jgi:hypothetical protein
MLQPAAGVRLAMWRNGYAPLPVQGKNPDVNGKGWQLKRQQTNEQEIRLWDRMYPYVINTGCLTRLVPTLDVDILDKSACRAVYGYVKERFEGRGYTLCRIGKAPKFAVPFQTDVPFRKITKKIIPPDGKPAQLEFLGEGNQFVCFGRHPDTGTDYRWWPADANPTTVLREELPHIDEAGARALVAELAELLVREHGFARPEEAVQKPVYKSPSDGAPRSPLAVRASVDGLIRTVLNAANGERSNTLFWATCRVRDMAANGQLGGEEVQDTLDALREAALRAGHPIQRINSTIVSGMRPR